MKEIYLVSFMEFKKKGQNMVRYAYAFETEVEARLFEERLHDAQCATISLHEVFDDFEKALERMKNEE